MYGLAFFKGFEAKLNSWWSMFMDSYSYTYLELSRSSQSDTLSLLRSPLIARNEALTQFGCMLYTYWLMIHCMLLGKHNIEPHIGMPVWPCLHGKQERKLGQGSGGHISQCPPKSVPPPNLNLFCCPPANIRRVKVSHKDRELISRTSMFLTIHFFLLLCSLASVWWSMLLRLVRHFTT